MLSTVESLTLNPRLASAPTMRLLPQVGFSWSSLTTSFSSAASTGGRPAGLVLAKVHFLATKTRNQQSKVSGVTKVANLPRRRRPTSLALRASRMRWASVKRLGLPPSCSRRTRFSSWRYSMTVCWCRLIQPATEIRRKWSCVVTEWRIFQKSLWLTILHLTSAEFFGRKGIFESPAFLCRYVLPSRLRVFRHETCKISSDLWLTTVSIKLL